MINTINPRSFWPLGACLLCLLLPAPIQAGVLTGPPEYSLEAKFEKLPADDGMLKKWLGGRKDFHKVKIDRRAGTLNVQFHGPKAPGSDLIFDLLHGCDTLGYGERAWFRGTLFDPAQRGPGTRPSGCSFPSCPWMTGRWPSGCARSRA